MTQRLELKCIYGKLIKKINKKTFFPRYSNLYQNHSYYWWCLRELKDKY